MKSAFKSVKSASREVVDVPAGPVYEDPFNPHFRSSTPVEISDEQKYYINECIDVAVSDTQFAAKLKAAIALILRAGEDEIILAPVLTELVPSYGVIGTPSFTLRVMGSGFLPTSVIVFAGQNEPTTFVSENEVTTGINMPLWVGADVVQVSVRNGVESSNELPFTFAFAPAISTITPNTIAVGGADFVLEVTGDKFTPESVIHIKDIPAPTTLVSPNLVTTPIDMALVLVPSTAPITVKNGPIVSNSVDFIVTP